MKKEYKNFPAGGRKIPGRRGSMSRKPDPEIIKIPVRLIREGTIGDCPYCGSTTVRRFIWFGKRIGCISPRCQGYYKKFNGKYKEKIMEECI